MPKPSTPRGVVLNQGRPAWRLFGTPLSRVISRHRGNGGTPTLIPKKAPPQGNAIRGRQKRNLRSRAAENSTEFCARCTKHVTNRLPRRTIICGPGGHHCSQLFSKLAEVAAEKTLGGVKSTPISRWQRRAMTSAKDAGDGFSSGARMIALGYDDPQDQAHLQSTTQAPLTSSILPDRTPF